MIDLCVLIECYIRRALAAHLALNVQEPNAFPFSVQSCSYILCRMQVYFSYHSCMQVRNGSPLNTEQRADKVQNG